jgi:hypothetical protein
LQKKLEQKIQALRFVFLGSSNRIPFGGCACRVFVSARAMRSCFRYLGSSGALGLGVAFFGVGAQPAARTPARAAAATILAFFLK